MGRNTRTPTVDAPPATLPELRKAYRVLMRTNTPEALRICQHGLINLSEAMGLPRDAIRRLI